MSQPTLTPALPMTASDLCDGPMLILAPHADDETLACGGLIAQLSALGQSIIVALVSDGTGSHPQSRTHTPEQRRAVREAEFADALDVLTDDQSPRTAFLRFPDTQVPRQGSAGFGRLTEAIGALLRRYQPATVITPWRRDPHCDHRATTEGVLAALTDYPDPVRLLEYPVWVYEIAETDDAPRPDEVAVFALDVTAQLSLKQKAVQAHRSQLDNTVFDDPNGFFLTESMLGHFARPNEYFYLYQ